jgi:uncharacterized alpha/beta hydrolase family protein
MKYERSKVILLLVITFIIIFILHIIYKSIERTRSISVQQLISLNVDRNFVVHATLAH